MITYVYVDVLFLCSMSTTVSIVYFLTSECPFSFMNGIHGIVRFRCHPYVNKKMIFEWHPNAIANVKYIDEGR